ncbi:hypothetical protein EG329_004327 [Mollisiaceae sp. DMI_Dod_QoI]|nr:hypothetical protein EG329_004327 [Helotiales sp. DMI_Dod_QoI]
MTTEVYHENREILYEKASRCLPNFPKKPTDFYVAILPHKKSVRNGEWEDLLWLRVRGKHTVAQVKKFYATAFGTQVIFMDGGSVVREDTQIRALNHLKTDLVALWTVAAEREPLGEAGASRQNILALQAEKSVMGKLFSSSSKHDCTLEHKKRRESQLQMISDLRAALATLNRRRSGSQFVIEDRYIPPVIKCTSCPDWTYMVASVSIAMVHVELHLESDSHKAHYLLKSNQRLDSPGSMAPNTAPLSASNPNGKITEAHTRELSMKAHTNYPGFQRQIEEAFKRYTRYRTDCTDCYTFFRNVIRVRYTRHDFPDVCKHTLQHALVPVLNGELRALSQGSSMEAKLVEGGLEVSCTICPAFQVLLGGVSVHPCLQIAKSHLKSAQHNANLKRTKKRHPSAPFQGARASSPLSSKTTFQIPDFSDSDGDLAPAKGEINTYHRAQTRLKRKSDISPREDDKVFNLLSSTTLLT